VCQLFSYNSFPVIPTTIEKKSSFLRTPAFIFCLPWGRPCGNHAKRCMNEKTIAKPLAACTHLSSTVSQLFDPQVQKIAVFTYRSPHFCFPWRRPCGNHAICCMDGKTISKPLAKPLAAYTYLSSIVSTFRVIRCLSQCVSPKIAIFYHIFVSSGDAPEAITLNVVWMEREIDAYKLPRCMCPSNYNRF